MELSGLLLLLLLGLRHGFDPDHIAIIDGVSVRFNATKPGLAKWAGTLFAAGHGSVVTCIAIMISRVSHAWDFPKMVWDILDWLPGVILIIVGLLNLRMLTRKDTYRPRGFKSSFIPARLRNSSNPLAIVLIGVLFAMVFDTNTQAAAWAYTATSKLSTLNALLLGLSFSVGMITTDTLDSRILFTLMQRSSGNSAVLNYRRKLGWIIVFVSFIVGIYKLISHFMPSLEIPEITLTWVGVMFFVMMVIFYIYIITSGIQTTKKEAHGN
jgi:high-affinity nickel-transport protein